MIHFTCVIYEETNKITFHFFKKKINSFCSPPHSYISRESSLSPGPSLPLIWPAIWRVLYVLFSLCWPQNPGAPWGWRDPLTEFQEHFIVAGFLSKRDTLSGSLIWVTAADTRVFFDEKRSWSVVRPTLPPPELPSPPPTNTHPCSTPNWPAPNILLLKSTHFPASFLGASNLAKAGLGQPPVSTTTWTLNGHHPAVIDSLPSRSKKSPPRRHVLTSTFRATGSKFLENFQHILSLISPLGL